MRNPPTGKAVGSELAWGTSRKKKLDLSVFRSAQPYVKPPDGENFLLPIVYR
jgi:hypothetical protein